MSKILVLNCGLEHSHEYLTPFIDRLASHLNKDSDYVDVRHLKNFDERVFFSYDQVVFAFFTAMHSIPSSLLEIFSQLENQDKKDIEVYALIVTDEYESEKCDYAHKILRNWCSRENLKMMGTLKIGSGLIIFKTPSRFVLSNTIRKFAVSILKHQSVHYRMTLTSVKIFLKKANHYWAKEIKKNKKTD